jgi:hypothetical protein
MTCTRRAAWAAGATVGYVDVHGNATSSLVFRTSPGRIYSTRNNYTHAVVAFPDCAPLEVHIGVYVQGRSKVVHECDVLVLPQAEAEICRERRVLPRSSKGLVAIECKFYGSSLGIALARGLQGLHSDMGIKRPVFVANVRDAHVERYLTHHGRHWENAVLPRSSEAMYLEAHIREAFKEYRATGSTP